MNRCFFIAILIFALIVNLSAQEKKSQLKKRPGKPVKTHPRSTNLSVGAGMTRSVLFLARNVKENNDAYGYTFSMAYGISPLVRANVEYTYYKPINIDPTWYNIEANTIEANAHLIAKFRNSKAIFYPIVGISYNHFSGFFTGRNDFMGLYERYPINSTIVTNWLGVNIGTGYEYKFGPLSAFLDYKMRIGYNDGQDKQLNIVDVCVGAGLRYTIKVPSMYRIMKGTKNRYFLDTE